MIDKGNNRPPVPPRQSSYGDFDTVMDTVAQAVKDGPYLLGQQFTAADVVLGSCLQYGTMIKALPERPEFTAYLGRLQHAPGVAALVREEPGAVRRAASDRRAEL